MAVRFKKLVIVGVGLLGGSLGMAARGRGLAAHVVGVGRDQTRLRKAQSLRAIDSFTLHAREALAGADALVLALPPRQIREAWGELADWIAPGTFVTDVGSVKAGIVAAAEAALAPGVLFVGSHPMAGSEKSGIEAARADLYQGAACLITPTAATGPGTLAIAREFWQTLGMRVTELDPAAHDALLAGISHLPHLAAAALMCTLHSGGVSAETLARIAGPGLRDTTRIAASDPELWSQIFSENAPALLDSLDALIAELQRWRKHLHPADPQSLLADYKQASDLRRSLDQSS